MNANSRSLTSDNPGSDNALASSIGYIQDSEVMATHASLFSVPAQQPSISTTNHLNNGDQWTTRMGGQQPGTSQNNEDWSTTITRRRRRKWGPFGGDVSESESLRGKRKASYDAPEKTRKIRKNSNYLEVSQCEQFGATSTTPSDTRCVGFGSSQEVTQSEADDIAYMVPVHPLHHFPSDGFTGFPARGNSGLPDQAVTQQSLLHSYESLTPQEGNFDEYLNPRERLANMFDAPCIPTWRPTHNLDYGFVIRHGHGEGFGLHQDQHGHAEGFTTHLEHLPERLAYISSILLIL